MVWATRDLAGPATHFVCVWTAKPHLTEGCWIHTEAVLISAGSPEIAAQFFGVELKPGECKAFSITEVTVQ